MKVQNTTPQTWEEKLQAAIDQADDGVAAIIKAETDTKTHHQKMLSEAGKLNTPSGNNLTSWFQILLFMANPEGSLSTETTDPLQKTSGVIKATSGLSAFNSIEGELFNSDSTDPADVATYKGKLHELLAHLDSPDYQKALDPEQLAGMKTSFQKLSDNADTKFTWTTFKEFSDKRQDKDDKTAQPMYQDQSENSQGTGGVIAQNMAVAKNNTSVESALANSLTSVTQSFLSNLNELTKQLVNGQTVR